MNNAASIKARLRNLAIKEQKPYDYIQTHFMIERLLYRLSISRYSDDFILKGVHICLGAIVKAENRIPKCMKVEAGVVIENRTYLV